MLVTDAWLLVAAIILRLETRPAPRGTGLRAGEVKGYSLAERNADIYGSVTGITLGKIQPSKSNDMTPSASTTRSLIPRRARVWPS